MNPVAMTIINPRKEYWPSQGSNQRFPVLKSATLPTELWGSASLCVEELTLVHILNLSKSKTHNYARNKSNCHGDIFSFINNVSLLLGHPTLRYTILSFNSLPNYTFLDWSKFKVFADDKLNVTQKLKFDLERVESIA